MALKNKEGRYTTEIFQIPGFAFDTSIKDPKARIQAYIDSYSNQNADGIEGPDHALMRKHLTLLAASATPTSATATYTMTATKHYTSRMGNMHGGSAALIMDMCTSMCAAPLARPQFWEFGGVSRVLSLTYLRPIPEGTELVIECEVLQQGKRLATMRGVMRDRKDGKVLVVAEHNKASVEFVDAKATKL